MTPGIPLTIVGGYLGSGKTSAIVELLTAGARSRMAVVVNDFGELDFDARLLSGGSDDLVSFSNGCICCSAADGMSPALAALRERAPERVLVEASGVGDPTALAAWGTSPGYRPGGVIVCADALTIGSRLRDKWVGDTVARQLAAADVVLVTHADLASSAMLAGARFLIGLRAPQATILIRGDETGLGAALAAIDEPTLGGRIAPAEHAEHETWTLRSAEPIERWVLEAALIRLPGDVVRLKGFARFAGEPDRAYAVQYAGTRYGIVEDTSGSAPLDTVLTVIARRGAVHELPALTAAGLREVESEHPAHHL